MIDDLSIPRSELATSMIFYRRRLAEKIAQSAITAAGGLEQLMMKSADPAADIEDLANAITERLAARETGDPSGYSKNK